MSMTDTAKLRVDGDARTFALALGQSILDAAMEQGVAIDHACGGVCACSTCHVRVRAGFDCLSEPSEDELDQLDEARDAGLDSRLACQAKLIAMPKDGEVLIAIPKWNVNAVREGH